MVSNNFFLDQIRIILTRPGMFGIQKVEDINLVFFSEIFINRNTSLETWSKMFNDFVVQDSGEHFQNFHWSKIIRLFSGSDAHSLELFGNLLEKFTDS